MADESLNVITIDSDTVKENTEAINENTYAKKMNSESSEKATTSFDKYSSLLKTGVSLLGQASVATRDFSTNNDNLARSFFKSKDAAASVTESIKGLSGVLGMAFDTKTVDRFINSLGGIASKVGDKLDFSTQLNQNFANIAKSSGQFTQYFDTSSVDNLKNSYLDLYKKVSVYNDYIARTSVLQNLRPEETRQYANDLAKIAGGMTNITNTISDGKNSFTSLEAVLKIGSATGLGYSETINQIKEKIQQVSNTKFSLETDKDKNEQAIKALSQIRNVSDQIKASPEDVNKALTNIQDSFKMTGDVSSAASKIIVGNFQSLRESGLTAQQSLGIIQQMTSSISNLDVAQRAFLSSQTGGPGGLKGAFQIEKLIRDGKLDEVFNKVQQALNKQFGKIVSLDDAASSENAAAQYQKQLTMLTSGPLKMANNQQEAERILSAMSKKQTGSQYMASQNFSTEDAFKKNMMYGQIEAEMSMNPLTQAAITNRNRENAEAYNQGRIVLNEFSPFYSKNEKVKNNQEVFLDSMRMNKSESDMQADYFNKNNKEDAVDKNGVAVVYERMRKVNNERLMKVLNTSTDILEDVYKNMLNEIQNSVNTNDFVKKIKQNQIQPQVITEPVIKEKTSENNVEEIKNSQIDVNVAYVCAECHKKHLDNEPHPVFQAGKR